MPKNCIRRYRIGLQSELAGDEGIVCGFSAIYAGLAQVLNEAHGKTVLPLCPGKQA